MLNKIKGIQVVQSMFSKQVAIKMEIIKRNVSGKFPNIWKLNTSLLNNPWVK